MGDTRNEKVDSCGFIFIGGKQPSWCDSPSLRGRCNQMLWHGYERDCRAENALRELRLSEDEGTMHYLKPAETVFGRAKWVEAKNVNFSDDKISGEVKGGLSLLGASMTLSIDRYTGVMTDDTWQGEDRWACRAVATERAF